MNANTKRALDAALDELKREGYMILALIFNQKSDESLPMGNAVEVTCNFTNDQRIVSAMLRESLLVLTQPRDEEDPLKIQ